MMSAPGVVKKLGGHVGLKTVSQAARLAGESRSTLNDWYKNRPKRFKLIIEALVSRIENLNDWQEGKPSNSDLKVLKIHGVNGKFARCLGWYEPQWNKWYTQDGVTEVHPLAFANLIEAK